MNQADRDGAVMGVGGDLNPVIAQAAVAAAQAAVAAVAAVVAAAFGRANAFALFA
jgi:hypothetical protein